MFGYKNKEGDLVQIIKPEHTERWFMKIFSAERKYIGNQIFRKELYSGYGIEMIKGENGIYVPNKQMEIDWYSDIKKQFVHPINENEMDFIKLIPYLRKFQTYIAPSRNSEEPIDPIND